MDIGPQGIFISSGDGNCTFTQTEHCSLNDGGKGSVFMLSLSAILDELQLTIPAIALP